MPAISEGYSRWAQEKKEINKGTSVSLFYFILSGFSRICERIFSADDCGLRNISQGVGVHSQNIPDSVADRGPD